VLKDEDLKEDFVYDQDQTIVKLTIGNVEYFASGRNKKEAKQVAAKWALSSGAA